MTIIEDIHAEMRDVRASMKELDARMSALEVRKAIAIRDCTHPEDARYTNEGGSVGCLCCDRWLD